MSPKVSDLDLLNNLCAKCGRPLLLHVDGAACPGAISPKHDINSVADLEKLSEVTGDPSGAARAPQTTEVLLSEVKGALARFDALPSDWAQRPMRWLAEVCGPDLALLTGKIRALVQAVEDHEKEVSRLRADGQRLRDAAQLKRNVLMYDGAHPGFMGDWVAIPREDFEALRATVSPRPEGA